MAKESPVRTVSVMVGTCLIVLAWGIAFGAIKGDVKYISERTLNNREKLDKLSIEFQTLRSQLVKIDTRQEDILKCLQKIDAKLEEGFYAQSPRNHKSTENY